MEQQLMAQIQRLGIKELNEMQNTMMHSVENQGDIILLSATGSGKTIGFLLPLLKRLKPEIKHPQAMIIVPSRELAIQIDEVLRKLQSGYKVTLCYGGHKREIEETNLIEAPAIIIGTAGRLADHVRRGNFNVEFIETLILDEFDKSLEVGFLEEMEYIISSCKNLNKRILTSATSQLKVPDFVLLNQPTEINFLGDKLTESLGLEVKVLESPEKDKVDSLFELLCQIGNRSSIIFCNHRESVERTSQKLSEKGIFNVYYHGGMEQRDRDVALCKFRNGTSDFLVTTDLAARGLDIPNIRNIIHYHLPDTEATFTHRNGRTARMDASGTAILILGFEEKLPGFLTPDLPKIKFEENYPLPEKPKWTTLFIDAGKKDKINKVDIVGFLSQKGDLKKEDLGLIEVKDFFSFVAIKKAKASSTLHAIQDLKMKGRKIRFAVAK